MRRVPYQRSLWVRWRCQAAAERAAVSLSAADVRSPPLPRRLDVVDPANRLMRLEASAMGVYRPWRDGGYAGGGAARRRGGGPSRCGVRTDQPMLHRDIRLELR
jgi:hypothetical protein